jgi:hypothetical protein
VTVAKSTDVDGGVKEVIDGVPTGCWAVMLITEWEAPAELGAWTEGVAGAIPELLVDVTQMVVRPVIVIVLPLTTVGEATDDTMGEDTVDTTAEVELELPLTDEAEEEPAVGRAELDIDCAVDGLEVWDGAWGLLDAGCWVLDCCDVDCWEVDCCDGDCCDVDCCDVDCCDVDCPGLPEETCWLVSVVDGEEEACCAELDWLWVALGLCVDWLWGRLEIPVHVVVHVFDPDVAAEVHSVFQQVHVEEPEDHVASDRVEVSVHVVAHVSEPVLTPEDHMVRSTVQVDGPKA